jgi:uncharacterized membrane protein YphA (DoxX/SURF4 family)
MVLLAARIVLGVVFGVVGSAKLVDQSSFADAAAEFAGLPRRPPSLYVVP